MSTNITVLAGAAIPASITIPASNPIQNHASRLHTKYVQLDFKNDPADPQDARREVLFKRLVLHHRVATNQLTTNPALEVGWLAR
jgi:hypothetical protein